MNKFHMFLIGLIAVSSLSLGVASANPITDLIVEGSLEVNGLSEFNGSIDAVGDSEIDGKLTLKKSLVVANPNLSAITVQNTGNASNVIKFFDKAGPGSAPEYNFWFRQYPNTGEIQFYDQTNDVVRMSIDNSNGDICMGTGC